MLKKAFILFILFAFLLPLNLAADVRAPDYSALVNRGSQLARAGQWDLSEKQYLQALASPVPDHRLQAYEGLHRLYGKLKMSRKASRAKAHMEIEKSFLARLVPEDPSFYTSYQVRQGDTYAKISSREGISLEWLKRANRYQKLIKGKTIRLPVMKYTIRVSKSNLTLEWRRGEEVLKIYPVAVGKKETETPGGEFTVTSKVSHPVWYHLKVRIPPDSPKNMLGTRWLGLNIKSYGIHGTRNPRSIRSAASSGCVRMLNRDVEELFEWISVGTKVTIE